MRLAGEKLFSANTNYISHDGTAENLQLAIAISDQSPKIYF